MKCPTILARLCEIQSHMNYEHIFGNVNEQSFIKIVKVREDLFQEQEDNNLDQEDHNDSQDDSIGLPEVINNTEPST